MAEFIPILAILCVFGVPLSAIWLGHRQKILEMQLRLRQQGDASVNASLEALREEVRNLRDTSMQYDLSFDNALQRMEQRVEGLERRVNEISGSQTVGSQTVSIGRGD